MSNTHFTIDITNRNSCIIREFFGEGCILVPNEFVQEGQTYTVVGIGPSAFAGNTNISKVILPSSIEVIGDEAFMDCQSLNSIVLKDGLKTIGNCAFVNCVSLEHIDLPKTVERIGDFAFSNCNKLKTVVIPDGATISDNAFTSYENEKPIIHKPGIPKPVLPKPNINTTPAGGSNSKKTITPPKPAIPEVKPVRTDSNDINTDNCIKKAQLFLGHNQLVTKEEGSKQLATLQTIAENLEKLVQKDDSEAMFYLGKFYLFGYGVGTNKEKAIYLINKAAELGYVKAQYYMGMHYLNTKDKLGTALKWLMEAAENGLLEAQISLGTLYYENGIHELAIKWLKIAAEQDNSKAQYYLARCFQEGTGVDKNPSLAMVWYSKAAKNNYIDAQYELAQCYNKGTFFNIDKEQAFTWFHEAAVNGHAQAKMEVGLCYLKGLGVNKDLKKALYWFIKSGSKDFNAEAQFYAGSCFLKGNGSDVEKDDEKAAIWFEMAAKQGHIEALFQLGCLYKKGNGVMKDEKNAVELFMKAAEQGHVKAQYHLGCCYGEGEGIGQDYAEAIIWLEKAAKNGYSQAEEMLDYYKSQFEKTGLPELGIVGSNDNQHECFTKGQEALMKRNYKSAVLYLSKAADMGHAQAQYYLGNLYDSGSGVEQNFQTAFDWYTKSAEGGFYLAQFVLGQRYDIGLAGVEQDFESAVKWYTLAAASLPVAKVRLAVMHFKGIGTERNYTKAFHLFEEAVVIDQSGECKFYLGKCYKHGLGVDKNEQKGQALMEEAKQMGYFNE